MNEPRKHKALTAMACRDLDRWARVYAERDQLVRSAYASGVGVNEIARRMGIAKTTVIRILAPRRSAIDAELVKMGAALLTDDEAAAPELAGVDPVVDELATWPERVAERWDEPEPAAAELVVADELVDVDGPLVVIGCGAGKLDHPAPAAELYTGTYFRECLATARAIARPADIRILSGKHGLVRLDDVLEPYDVTLGDPFDRIPTRAVTAQAIAQGVAGRRVLALCSTRYADLLRAAGFKVDAPLANLGIGRQRRKLAEMRRA